MAANSVLSSLIWKSAERLMVQGLGIVIQILLARLLLPEDFASLAIINAIVIYLGIFVQSGLSVAIVQKKDLTPTDTSTLVTISLLVATILYVLLFVSAPLISNYYNFGELTWPIRVMGLALFLYSFNSIQTGLLQRKMQFRAIFLRSMIATPLSGIIGVAMAYMGFGVWALIAYSISNILFIVLFMNFMPELRLKLGFSAKSAKELYSFSIKIIGTNLISAGGDTLRTMTIGKAYTPNQLAFYDRGYSLSSLVTQVVNASISSVILPVLSRQQDDIAMLKSMARRSVSMSAFIMVPILFMVAVIAEPLISFVLTDKWLPSAIFLSIFCALRIPGIITSVDKQAYYALGKSHIGLYYEIVLLCINITLLITLLPYGVFAIAIGYTAIEYVGNFVLCIISSKEYDYTLKERIADLSKPLANGLLMSVVMSSIHFMHFNNGMTLFLQIPIGIIFYLMMAKLTKDANLKQLYNIVKKLRTHG